MYNFKTIPKVVSNLFKIYILFKLAPWLNNKFVMILNDDAIEIRNTSNGHIRTSFLIEKGYLLNYICQKNEKVLFFLYFYIIFKLFFCTTNHPMPYIYCVESVIGCKIISFN